MTPDARALFNELSTRLQGRVAMNVVTEHTHPDPQARRDAQVRVAAYLTALSDAARLLIDLEKDP